MRMFDVTKNRLSYSEQLIPKEGYQLDFAACMTYSVDLEAALGIPVSFNLLEEADEQVVRHPFSVLEALKQGGERLAFFCNATSMASPKRVQRVFSLLDASIFPVALENKASFHPKVWVVAYNNEQNERYIKVLILSRNLTFDQSLDVCVSMEGKVGTKYTKKHQPLADLLQFCKTYANPEKQEKVEQLAQQLLLVDKFSITAPFENYEFLPIGIPNHKGKNPAIFGPKADLFVVSPFLSNQTVQEISKGCKKSVLITRKQSITPEIFSAFKEIYITKDVLTDNEYQQQHDVHAKVYFVSDRKKHSLFLGSANASYSAYQRNVECLLRLDYIERKVGFESFKLDWIPREFSPFEQVLTCPEIEDVMNEENTDKEILQAAVYAIQGAGVVWQNEQFNIEIDTLDILSDTPIYIAPLQRKEAKVELKQSTNLCGLLLHELSEFYLLSVGKEEIVIKIDTIGIPKERNQAIVRQVIDSKEKLVAYLSLVLSEERSVAMMEISDHETTDIGNGRGSKQSLLEAGLYEKLLVTLQKNPKKIIAVKEMVHTLGKETLPTEFLTMFDAFEEAVRSMEQWN